MRGAAGLRLRLTPERRAMKEQDTGIGVTVRFGEVALTFEVKKANPLDPPIKIEAQKPAKLLLEKRDKRYEDD